MKTQDVVKTQKNSQDIDKKPPKDIKKREWTFVLYPESAPEDWRDIIRQRGLVAASSPLHDRDINADGTPKKPHHHVILVYDGPTTYNNVLTFCQGELKGTVPKVLDSPRGMYTYFTHEDNPEKAQYEKCDIEHFNGFNITDLCMLKASEIFEIKKRVLEFIDDNDIIEYADLVRCLMLAEMKDELQVTMDSTFFFDKYITSRRNSYGRLEDKVSKKRNEVSSLGA
jgi:hypothetical protein